MSMPNLTSGNYSIRQLPEFGWANGQLTCPAPPGPTQPTGTAFVPAGGEVVCRVTNVKLASLVIQKVTSPAGTAGTFVFGANAGLSPASFSLADGQQQRIDNITPGQTVAVNELVPANWLLSTSGTGCTSTGFGVTVNLAPGQVLTCTFTNTVATPTIVITPPNVPPGGTVDIAIGGLPPGAVDRHRDLRSCRSTRGDPGRQCRSRRSDRQLVHGPGELPTRPLHGEGERAGVRPVLMDPRPSLVPQLRELRNRDSCPTRMPREAIPDT